MKVICRSWLFVCAPLVLTVLLSTSVHAQVAGESGSQNLVVAAGGKTSAIVVVSADAGEWEKRAAADLVHYVEQMTGAAPKLADTPEAVAASLKSSVPLLIVGRAALYADPSLKTAIAKAAKLDLVVRADAIAVRRKGNRIYLAGNNDDSHYYAAAELLRRWGCRWYLPGEIGECIPKHESLAVGDLDYVYAPPFEVRRYWLSWNGDNTGKPEFMRRNFFNDVSVPNGHALAKYTKELIPEGKTMFNVPITEDKTADHVAKGILPQFAAGKNVMLGMEDGLYESDSAADKELIGLQYDKYFLTQSYSDAFIVFYNKVAKRVSAAAPKSDAKIGFLIYANMTLPPVRDVTAAKPLVGYLAPIDFDPIHGMDDRWAPRREYKEIMQKWAKVMQGRLVIYDYDQGMLVWRDIPNPSHQAFRQDVQHYRDAGILGVDVESRGAMATTFTNLYLRGQLTWNPDADVDALLAEFYEKFYGPAATPMAAYWNAIFAAWDNTIVTEHEHFVAPAIYTPELLAELRGHLAAADAAANSIAYKNSSEAALVLDRLHFARLGNDVLNAYMAMVKAAATDVDYKAAVAAGERGLAAREKLTEMDGTFTTYKRIGERGYAWWPGEVKQYRELLPYTDGTKGKLVAKLPLVWNLCRDVDDVGVKENWANQPVDLVWWNKLEKPVSLEDRQNNLGHWEEIRTDLYAQAQGIVTKDFQSYTGHLWYQTDVTLDAAQTKGPLHLRFPGMFNEAWLYINGEQVAHRELHPVWWRNDYRFEWDVDVADKLKPGENSIVVRLHNPHHFGGMFRRPFLYRNVE